MGRVYHQGLAQADKNEKPLSEEYDGYFVQFFGGLEFTERLTLCIEVSANVGAYLAERSPDSLQGEGFKIVLEPGRTAVRNVNEVLPTLGAFLHYRCADGTCPRGLATRRDFQLNLFTLDSSPTLNYWYMQEETRIKELQKVLAEIAENINWWYDRTAQGHPEYQSEIEDLNRQCERALNTIAELSELGVESPSAWYEVCEP